MDVIEHLVDVVTSFHPMAHCDKFLTLMIFIILFVVITLLALKCMLIYLPRDESELPVKVSFPFFDGILLKKDALPCFFLLNLL